MKKSFFQCNWFTGRRQKKKYPTKEIFLFVFAKRKSPQQYSWIIEVTGWDSYTILSLTLLLWVNIFTGFIFKTDINTCPVAGKGEKFNIFQKPLKQLKKKQRKDKNIN